jgi:uncharacterized protein HemX
MAIPFVGAILGFFGGWKVKAAIAGLVVIAIGAGLLYVRTVRAERDTAVLELAVAGKEMQRLSAANQNNLLALERLQNEKVASQAALERRNADVRRLERAGGSALGGIADAPETSNASVAPLYFDALRRVREYQQDRAAPGDGNP